jgi:ATP-dependent Clp protease ATP-binding subunit ClpC
MFDRYTDRARRCIFYARESVSKYGSMTIETEHLLLGILKEDPNIIPRFLPSKTNEDIRAEVAKRTIVQPEIPTNIDLPLSKQCGRILDYATKEAETFGHSEVGVEHLLLGVLREEEGVAGQILRLAGLNVEAVRLRQQLSLGEAETE